MRWRISHSLRQDYDKFIEDYEVKNALAAVKNRIAELAQGKVGKRRRRRGERTRMVDIVHRIG